MADTEYIVNHHGMPVGTIRRSRPRAEWKIHIETPYAVRDYGARTLERAKVFAAVLAQRYSRPQTLTDLFGSDQHPEAVTFQRHVTTSTCTSTRGNPVS